MKAFQLSAALCAVLFMVTACKTAPGGGSADAKAQEGLNDALGQIGDVSGMDGYQLRNSVDSGGGITYTLAREVYSDASFTKFSFIQSGVYDGTGDIGLGSQQTFNNDIILKEATTGDLTELTGLDTYQFDVQGESNIDKTGLSDYKIYRPANVTAKSWNSSKAGGNDTWEAGSSAGLDNPEEGLYIKKEGNKLIFMIVRIISSSPGGSPTSSIQFNFEDDPRSPSSENTYTKK